MEFEERRNARTRRMVLGILCLMGVVMLAAIGWGVRHFFFEGSDAALLGKIGGAQRPINAKFASGTTQYEPPAEITVEDLPDGKVRVAGTVEVISPDGVRSRYSYTCVISKNEDSDWVADELNLIPI